MGEECAREDSEARQNTSNQGQKTSAAPYIFVLGEVNSQNTGSDTAACHPHASVIQTPRQDRLLLFNILSQAGRNHVTVETDE